MSTERKHREREIEVNYREQAGCGAATDKAAKSAALCSPSFACFSVEWKPRLIITILAALLIMYSKSTAKLIYSSDFQPGVLVPQGTPLHFKDCGAAQLI